MVIVFLLSEPLRRKLTAIDILASSGIISLLLDSNQAFSISFKLTFLAVFSILFIFNNVNEVYFKYLNPITEKSNIARNLLNKDTMTHKYIITTVLISVSITIGTLPLIMYEFGGLNLFSIVLNVLLIPLTGIAYSLTTLILISSYISSVFTSFLAYVLEIINSFIFSIIDINYLSELFSFHYKFRLPESIFFAFIVIFVIFYKNRVLRIISLSFLTLTVITFLSDHKNTALLNEVDYSFIYKESTDIIQDRARIISSSNGENILLISANTKKSHLKNIIIPYMYNIHIHNIDFLIFLDKTNNFQKKVDLLNYIDKHNKSEFYINIKNVLIYEEDKNKIGEFSIFNKEYLPKMYHNTNFIDIKNIANNLKLITGRIFFYDKGYEEKNLNYEIYL